MFRHFRKYRNLFAIGTMFFYALVGLQFPLLECLHICSHLGNLTSHSFEKHSFHAHSSGHSHIVLDFIDNLEKKNDGDNSPLPQTADLEIKKLLQHCLSINDLAIICQNKFSPVFSSPLLKTTPIYSNISPPPKV